MARLHSLKSPFEHRVAIIDDDADLLAATCALMQREGHLVKTAPNPRAGIDLVRAWRPHLILLDYYMDGGTGADVVREIRAFDPHVQVLLVTGYSAEQPGRKLMRDLDIQGYHNKSDGADRMLVLADGALKQYRSLQRLVTQQGYLERILSAVPEINQLQPTGQLFERALEQLSAIVNGGDGLVAATNNGLFVLGDADAQINIHAGTGKYSSARSLPDLPPKLAEAVRSGISASAPTYHPCGALLIPLKTRDGDRGCMFLETASMPENIAHPAMVYAKLVVQSLENVLLFEMATVDALTRVFNRGHGTQRLRESLKLASRSGRPTSVALLDIDFFKRVNDTHGHAAGDVVLRRTGELLLDTCRESDVVTRYGGEEFLVLMPDTDDSGGRVLAERLRRRIEALEVNFEGQQLRITASVGLATSLDSSDKADMLVRAADTALYQAKALGRNRVCRANQPSRGAA